MAYKVTYKLSDLNENLKKEIYRIGHTKAELLALYDGIVYTNRMTGKFKPCRSYSDLYKIAATFNETYEYIYAKKPVKGYIYCDFIPELGVLNSKAISIKELIESMFS